MNTQKHTPGPWHFDGKAVSAKGQPNVCRLENGHLIAAAPDLLAALKWLVKEAGDCLEVEAPSGLQMARAAISKAEGEQ